MKIIYLSFCLTLLLSNCSKTVILPLVDGYAEFNMENAQDSVFALEFNNNDLLRAEGHFFIDKSGSFTTLKHGTWIYYHDNGQLKSKGSFRVGNYMECGAVGPREILYNYKFGFWEYYYSNGQLKAIGDYNLEKLKINSLCGRVDFQFGLTTEDWKFYTLQGEPIEPSLTELREFEMVKTEHHSLEYFAPDSTRKNIKWVENRL